MAEDESADAPIPAFLDSTGAVELLCEIEPNGSQFTHFVENAPVSRATVSNRLQEGVERGVFERFEIEGRGTSHAYRLTEAGAVLRCYLDHLGLTERYRMITELQQGFDERVDEFREWMHHHEEAANLTISEDSSRHELIRYSTLHDDDDR